MRSATIVSSGSLAIGTHQLVNGRGLLAGINFIGAAGVVITDKGDEGTGKILFSGTTTATDLMHFVELVQAKYGIEVVVTTGPVIVYTG